MQSIFDQIKVFKKLSDKFVNIPFSYVIFLGTIFLLWKPKYINMINASGWVPENIRMIILDISNSLYSNILVVLSILIVVLFILFLLIQINIFDKILPKAIYFNDNMKEYWNPFSAIGRIIRIMLSLITTCWIYYFTFNILFNEHHYAQNFLYQYSPISDNELIKFEYITARNLEIMNALFYLNVIVATWFIIRAWFVIRIPTNKFSLKTNDLKSYIQINSFQENNSMDEKFETIILKTKHRKKSEFLLVKVQLSKYENQSKNYIGTKGFSVKEVPFNRRFYKIIDTSDNLSDIIYHFDALQNKIKQGNN